MDSLRILTADEKTMHEWIARHIRYKVLLWPDHTSTGLMHSTIIKYRKKRWNHPAEPPQEGKDGPGGLWANRNLGQAHHLTKYLWARYQRDSMIYLCLIDRILYESSYRTKTNRLYLLERIE